MDNTRNPSPISDQMDTIATFFDRTGKKVGGFRMLLTPHQVASVVGRWNAKLAPPDNVVRVQFDIALPHYRRAA